MEQKKKKTTLDLCSEQLIFSRMEFDPFLFILVYPNADARAPGTLKAQVSISVQCRREGASPTAPGHQQPSSQSSRAAPWRWAMTQTPVIPKSASAEAWFNSQQLKENAKFNSKSQEKAVAGL